MSVHNLLVPLRFLALLAHCLAAQLALYGVRDNVIVALPYEYTDEALAVYLYAARAAVILILCIIAFNAIGFFGGFSTFSLAGSLFHITFHALGSLLLALCVINKGHYLYLWYIAIVFSVPQMLVELYSYVRACILGGRLK